MKNKFMKSISLKTGTFLSALFFLLPKQVFAAGIGKADPAQLKKGLVIFLGEYNIIIGAMTGVAIMTGLLAFIWLLMKLAAQGGNPKERGEILQQMGVVGITTALLGALTFIVGVYYSVIIR